MASLLTACCSTHLALHRPLESRDRIHPATRSDLFTPEAWEVTEQLNEDYADKPMPLAAIRFIPLRNDLLQRYTFIGLTYRQVAALLGSDPTRLVPPPTTLTFDMLDLENREEAFLSLTFDLDDDWRLVVIREHVFRIPPVE